MRNEPRHRNAFRYSLILLGTLAACLLGMALFNALVDPFAMYRQISLEGFNLHKPAIYSRMRLYKAYEVMHVKPQTIILGSSRTHVALRCSHEAFSELEGPCYNLAFDGATAKEMYYYLLHADAIRPLKHVVLGLDSYHASGAPAMTRPDFDPLLLYSEGVSRWRHFLVADLRLLTSLDTLKASIRTLQAQAHPEPHWFAADGQRLGDIFFRQVQQTFMRQGPRAYFDEIDRQEVRDQAGPAAHAQAGEGAPDPDESSLSYIRRIVKFCRERHIDLRIFITPSHAHQGELAAMLWGEGALDDGKEALVRLLSEEQRSGAGGFSVPLMDFSGYSSVTTEPLPPPASRKEMRFYWDSSHFKEIVGDYVLDRLFDIHDASRPVPPDFGVVLDKDNLNEVLKHQRLSRAAYRKESAADIAALRALLPGLPILVYHEIRGKREEPWDESITVSLRDFEKQMRYLHAQGYRTLSMPEVMEYLQGKPFPAKVVAIHFDDGWKSAQDALPVLGKYGFKASFWIIAGAGHDVGSPHMDWDAIQALGMNPGIDIYSHTMTHPWKDGDTLVDWINTPKGKKRAEWELSESKRLLEEKLNRAVPYLAWPKGLYNEALVFAARRAGYKALLTIDNGFNHAGDDPYHIRRIMIDGRCDFSAFLQIMREGVSQHCAGDVAPSP